MKYQLFSYRYAAEILQHTNYAPAWQEIIGAVSGAPLYVWPNKSKAVKSLDVVQQLLNTHFDHIFSEPSGWAFHPYATGIPNSNLRADYRKSFGSAPDDSVNVQMEVQFGNMARWYSDIFKFQTAYSQDLAQVGVCIVPMLELAKRIDQNVVSFERAKRELPSAKLSITLPILMIGVSADNSTVVHDVSKSQFGAVSELTGKGRTGNRARVVFGIANGAPIDKIGPSSPTGSVPQVEHEEDDD